jgi:hypothetical protein
MTNQTISETSNKFTAIYTDSWIAGSHRHTLTSMKRIKQGEDESVEQMLKREDVLDGLVYLFHGHSLQEGEV